jgi:outer membrane protein
MRGAIFVALIAAALAARAEDKPAPRFEGAAGLIAHYAPSYGGADDYSLRLSPAGFVRYGRFTISGAGGFTTRRETDVERGFAAALIDRDELDLTLSARWTNGRKDSVSPRLAGLGDIEGTLLARLRLQWTPDGPWRYSLGVNADLLGHGSGWIADLGVARQWRLGPQTKLQFAASLTFGSDTYLQSWYGITPEQALRTGYAEYTPGNGFRDLGLSLTLRHEFSRHWGSYVDAGASMHIGAARHSPLVREPLGGSVGGGLVYRF